MLVNNLYGRGRSIIRYHDLNEIHRIVLIGNAPETRGQTCLIIEDGDNDAYWQYGIVVSCYHMSVRCPLAKYKKTVVWIVRIEEVFNMFQPGCLKCFDDA